MNIIKLKHQLKTGNIEKQSITKLNKEIIKLIIKKVFLTLTLVASIVASWIISLPIIASLIITLLALLSIDKVIYGYNRLQADIYEVIDQKSFKKDKELEEFERLEYWRKNHQKENIQIENQAKINNNEIISKLFENRKEIEKTLNNDIPKFDPNEIEVNSIKTNNPKVYTLKRRNNIKD